MVLCGVVLLVVCCCVVWCGVRVCVPTCVQGLHQIQTVVADYEAS
jgi:hypothetical protein